MLRAPLWPRSLSMRLLFTLPTPLKFDALVLAVASASASLASRV